MPTTGTVNTQQILQMGTLTEKLQHTLQHLPATTGQQLQDEQVAINELKQIEIQDPDKLEAINPTNSEGKRRREARLRSKPPQNNDMDNSTTKSSIDNLLNSNYFQGQKINITI